MKIFVLLLLFTIRSAAWAQSFPLDPDFEKQWWLHNSGQTDNDGQVGKVGADIKMLEALEVYRPQQDTILAIIDSGLDLRHSDIDTENLWTNKAELEGLPGVDDDGNGYIDDLHGWNMVHNNPDIQDYLYHGTHVGGMISAISNNGVGTFGRVPGVKIMIIKIWDRGGDPFASHVGEAVRYACDNGAKVLSNSYGTPSENQATKEAIAHCLKKGALFVGAAGNSGQDLDQTPDYPSSFAFANQLVVGASDNQDGRATFSNYGQAVEIFAPGKDIYSLIPNNKYRYLSGTSEACPLVALSAAMVWSQNPELDWKEVKSKLIAGADEFKRLKKWAKYGRRLNLLNSLQDAKGLRLPQFDFAQWETMEIQLESPHPYPRRTTTISDYQIPEAKRFRLHFSQLEVSNYDTLIIKDSKGEIIERYTGDLQPFWSQVIEGESVRIELKAGSSPLKYGYFIDKVQFL